MENKSNKLLGMALSLLSIVAGSLPADAAMGRADLVDAIAQVQYAWYTSDADRLVSLAETLEAEGSRGDIEHWQRYYTAYAYYRAAILAHDDYLGEYVSRCERNLRIAGKGRPEFSEGLILGGACAALLAEKRPIAAVLAPSRALRLFRKAQHLDPENPRLLLQQAQAAVGRRALADELPPAQELLAGAARLYASSTVSDSLAPDWGEADTYLLLGRLALEDGDRLRARDAIESALQVVPDFAAARELLGQLRERSLR